MVHKQTKGLTHDVVLMLSDGLSQCTVRMKYHMNTVTHRKPAFFTFALDSPPHARSRVELILVSAHNQDPRLFGYWKWCSYPS